MFSADEYNRSHSKLDFINPKGQALLNSAKVLVIGAGGLGCPCLVALAGASVGTLGIVDFDTIELSNLHRQTLYQFNDKGKQKAHIAAERLKSYNPFINIQAIPLMMDAGNVLETISAYNVIIDGTDNFYTRYLVNDACVVLNKPLVYGAIHQTEGHVTVFNYNGSATLRCLFPNDEQTSIPGCADIGAYNVTTGIIGMMMANEAIKIILHHPDVLAGKLNQVDTLTGRTLQVKYKEVIGNREKSKERFTKTFSSKTIDKNLLLKKINTGESFYLLDVRNKEEHDAFNIGGINIPLLELLQTKEFNFSTNVEIIVYCQKGVRSNEAAAFLQSKGFTKITSLLGGTDAWQKQAETIDVS